MTVLTIPISLRTKAILESIALGQEKPLATFIRGKLVLMATKSEAAKRTKTSKEAAR